MRKSKILFILSVLIISLNTSLSAAESWNKLMDSAMLNYQNNQIDKAIQNGVKALDSAESQLGKLDTNVADIASFLTYLHWSTQQFEEALKYARLDSAVRVKTQGTNNLAFALTLMNIGAQYAGMKNNQMAEKYFVESYETGKKVLNEKDQNLINLRNNLVQFYKGNGENEKADLIMKEAGISPQAPETWTDFMDKSYEAYDKNDLLTANEFGKKAFEVARRDLGDKDTNVANIAKNLTFLLWTQQKFDEALIYARLDSVTRSQSFGTQHPSFPATIMNIAAQYNGMRNYEKAEKYYIEAIEVAKKIYPGNHPEIINLRYQLMIFYSSTGAHEKAINMGKSAIELAKKEPGGLDSNVANLTTQLTYSLWSLNRYNEAIEYARLDSAIRISLFGKENKGYIVALHNLGANYNGNGQIDMAEKSYLEALQIIKKIVDIKDPFYMFSLSNLGQVYWKNGNYIKAEPLFNEVLELTKQISGDNNNEIATSLAFLADFYKDKSDFPNAEKFYLEALTLRKSNTYGGKSQEISDLLGEIGNFYQLKGDFANSEKYLVESLEISRLIFPPVSQKLSHSITNLAGFYLQLGDYKKSEPLFLEIIEMNKKLYKGDDENLISSLNILANYFYKKGDYKKSEQLFTEALEMSRRMYKSDNRVIASAINNTAFYYEAQKQYDKAEPLFIEGLQMARRLFKNNSFEIIVHIHNLAFFYSGQGKYDKAEPLYKEALELARQYFKGDHPEFANTIINVGFLYYNMGDYKRAEQLFKEAHELSGRIFNNRNIKLAFANQTLGNLYKTTKNYKLAEDYFKKALEVFINVINDYFPLLSESEKKNFWATQSEAFEAFYSFGSESSAEIPTVASEMYDLQLYSKALLFNSSIKIKNRIINSKDSALISLYDKLTEKKELLASIYSMPELTRKQKGFDLDSIEQSALTLEKQLSLKSEDFKLSYEKKKVTWKVIQGLLKPDEAAVEVIRFRYFDKIKWTDTIFYAFLIVTNDTEEHPDMIVFKNGNKLENEYYNEYRNLIKIKTKDAVSYDRFWGPLNEKLKNYKKIYFSPDGVYNRLNPSTLMMPDGKFLLDFYDIQQINSTKDILLGFYKAKQESNIFNNAVLIGNPNFSLAEQKVIEIANQIRSEGNPKVIEPLLADTRGIVLTNLPGTEKEIKNIEQFLSGKSWEVKTFLSDQAVKASVKTVQSPRILHIATHGLFLEDVEKGGKEVFGIEKDKLIDNPLLRSGLFFTGADNYLKSGVSGKTEDENGILTAFEAMNLNLDKTELVVLSACETGLGELQNGEGVFGLRRAFQQAGARTVLMSLWKVNDEATQALMSQFYSYWITGMTKREAFTTAQQEVRKKYPDPYFWGAFVMVGE